METSIQVKAIFIDRSQVTEVEQFNSLMNTYLDTLFGKVEKKPESKKNKARSMEGQFNTIQKRIIEKDLMSGLVIGKPTETEIPTTDIKNFYNKIVGE